MYVCNLIVVVVVVVVCAMTCRHAWGLRGDIGESVARARPLIDALRCK